MVDDSAFAYYEFFAGGGFARLGLSPAFGCAFANDIDAGKVRAYRAAFGAGTICEGDVWALEAAALPGRATLAWASFPCQDVSLAGLRRGGLTAQRSGAFWGFWRLMQQLDDDGRAPPLLALENVCGLLTSRGGTDFAEVVAALQGRGYGVGALEIDAAYFAPQSRPRLFVVARRGPVPAGLTSAEPAAPFHSAALIAAVAKLPDAARANLIWWRLPQPPTRNTSLADILDGDAAWDDPERTRKALAIMSPLQRSRIIALQQAGGVHVGALFRRIRAEDGKRIQRAEARFDGLAGCLRTPAGGSSRQELIRIEGQDVRTRLMTPREAARLMGAPDHYPLPTSKTAALHLLGDAVCVHAVRFLSTHVLEPLAGAALRDAA
jgi:DNA (cytosine-5)-methyltransferase 1